MCNYSGTLLAFLLANRFPILQFSYSQLTGNTPPLPPNLLSPNLLAYHFLPSTALGSILEISANTNHSGGVFQPSPTAPPKIQYPTHSSHSSV